MDNTDCKLVPRPALELGHKPELARKLEPERLVAQQQEPLLEPELVVGNKHIDRLSSNLLVKIHSYYLTSTN